MNNIKLLDCTLREAPVEGLIYGDNVIKGFVEYSVSSGIDVIEIGFLKDSEYVKGSVIFNRVEQIRKFLPKDRRNSIFTVMIDYGRYDISKLSYYDGTSIDAIRICFKKNEWKDAIQLAKSIKNKGYKVFFQHVDSMNYSDKERLEVLEAVNELKPYAYSIVDTFGSMYIDDMKHLFTVVERNLDKDIALGFHAHNNLMMASALAQEFLSISFNSDRIILVDGTVLGAGRGAGNANTELLMQYMNKKINMKYDLNALLDIIDIYMPVIMSKCSWGYSTAYFLSGINSTHVFNVNYLLKRHNIKARDLRAIINSMDCEHKKKYEYDYLEDLYLKQVTNKIDDQENRKSLEQEMKNQEVLVIGLGRSIEEYKSIILNYIIEKNPVVIGINALVNYFKYDYLFFGNVNRYEKYNIEKEQENIKLILTSNIKTESEYNEYIINYLDLIERKHDFLDNSGIMLLKLLGQLNIRDIKIAGLDGYTHDSKADYVDSHLISLKSSDTVDLFNNEMRSMLTNLKNNELRNSNIEFLTPSIYEEILRKV